MKQQDIDQVQADFPKLAELTLDLTLDGLTAFQVLANLQLAARHPYNADQWDLQHNYARRFAEALQRAVSITPALAAMAAAGWDPQEDMSHESAPEAGNSERKATDASVNASIDASITPA